MIHSVEIKLPTKTPVKWLGTVERFKKPCTVTFKPGLNILWGPNGCGKTTLLTLLARLFQCEQGGATTITENSIHEFFSSIGLTNRENPRGVLDSYDVRHDGKGVRFFNPAHARGMMAGGGAFDDDFFGEGIQNLLFKGSAGQTTLFRFEQILQEYLETGTAPEVQSAINRDFVNEHWVERLDIIQEFLRANSEPGPATILMDEPERSLSLPLQGQMWRFIRAYANVAQFIVASHAVFALNIPEANYIELVPGSIDAATKALTLLPGWSEEKPQPSPPTPREKTDEPRRPRRSQ